MISSQDGLTIAGSMDVPVDRARDLHYLMSDYIIWHEVCPGGKRALAPPVLYWQRGNEQSNPTALTVLQTI